MVIVNDYQHSTHQQLRARSERQSTMSYTFTTNLQDLRRCEFTCERYYVMS